MDEVLRKIAVEAIGFMPEEEGLALYRHGAVAGELGPLLEVGSYCGKSAVYLGAAARAADTVLFSIDHHRGSEEHQPGEEYYDERLVDAAGRVDTFPEFRNTVAKAGLEEVVIGIVSSSALVARTWTTPLGLVFIDGGHSMEAAQLDFDSWTSHLVAGGLLAIHDVFEDPAAGGRPPFEIYTQAVRQHGFAEIDAVGSLRVLGKG